MCDLPPRRLRGVITPTRILLTLVAVATVAGGMRMQDFPGILVLGFGLALLVVAVLFPTIKQVECGFPAGVKFTAALQDREDELQDAFERQKGELAIVTHLLCDDAALATQLLEAAWSRTAATWRGPVTPGELRVYVLCLFVHMLDAHRHIGGAGLLSALAPLERTVFVLQEFMDLSAAEIAALTGQPSADVSRSLSAAQDLLDRSKPDGDPS